MVDSIYDVWVCNDLLYKTQSNNVHKIKFRECKGKLLTERRYSSHTLKGSYQKYMMSFYKQKEEDQANFKMGKRLEWHFIKDTPMASKNLKGAQWN